MKDIIRIKSITQVHELLGLSKPKHPLVSVISIDEKIANFGEVHPLTLKMFNINYKTFAFELNFQDL